MGFRAPDRTFQQAPAYILRYKEQADHISAVKVGCNTAANKGGTTAPRPFVDEGAFLYIENTLIGKSKADERVQESRDGGNRYEASA